MFNNTNKQLLQVQGTTIDKWGKDQTGLISYSINNQGFRSTTDYVHSPDYAFFGSSSVFGIGVEEEQTMVSYFNNAHNYGLAGNYLNQESIINLESFLKHYINSTIVFFWVNRQNENILELGNYVKQLAPNILNISQGEKYNGFINLMPQIDYDISGTHPGPKTHRIWAKTIKELLK